MARMRGRLSVGLLGPLEVRVDSAPVVVPAGRQRVLLACLALSAGRVVGIDELADHLWGEQLPLDARRAVQNNVRRLRNLLGATAIRTRAGGYLLDVDPDEVDALRFGGLVARAAEVTPGERRELLEQALALWRGDPLAGVESERLSRDVASALAEGYLSAVEQLVDADFEAGQHGSHIAELTKLVARYPLREPLWVRLIDGLDRSGRRAEALRAYEEVRVQLAESLGSDPSPELQAVHRRLLDDDERPPASVTGTPRQLGAPTPWFTGRAELLAALDALIDRRGGSRLIVLHGAGGAGKTTLAVQWAHRVKDLYGDGQLQVDLRGYGPDEPLDSGAALGVMLRAVGVPPLAVPVETVERSALLRTWLAGRRLMVLLDNARDADQVRPLLPGGDSLVVVTSRNELRGLAIHDGAARFDVPSMSAGEAVEVLTRVISEGAVRPEPADQQVLAELAELCGRLPLALTIAAQHAIRHGTPAVGATVAALRDARQSLDPFGDATDQRSDLRAVISWSYRALHTESARAFRLLGVHPVPEFGLTVAAAILDRPPADARRLLDGLASVHLVRAVEPDRYRFHDLIAVFAAERAAADPAEARAATTRMVGSYLRSLAAARQVTFRVQGFDLGAAGELDVAVERFADPAEATQWCDRHQAALTALVDGGDDRTTMLLAYHLSEFHMAQENWLRQRHMARQAIAAADRSGTAADRARARYLMGSSWRGPERSTAIDWHLEALRLAEGGDDLRLVATVLSALGVAYLEKGDLPRAVESHRRSVQVATDLDPARLAHSLVNLGAVESATGDQDAAIRHTLRAVEIYRPLGIRYNLGLALGNLADFHLLAGHPPAEAIRLADEALEQVPGLDDVIVRPNALIARGRALLTDGDRDGARQCWLDAQRLQTGAGIRAVEVADLLSGLD